LRPELKRRAKKAALEKSISLSALFPDAAALLLFFFIFSIFIAVPRASSFAIFLLKRVPIM